MVLQQSGYIISICGRINHFSKFLQRLCILHILQLFFPLCPLPLLKPLGHHLAPQEKKCDHLCKRGACLSVVQQDQKRGCEETFFFSVQTHQNGLKNEIAVQHFLIPFHSSVASKKTLIWVSNVFFFFVIQLSLHERMYTTSERLFLGIFLIFQTFQWIWTVSL